MANRTDPAAKSVHGTNPQNLVEKILRTKIYQNTYWKEQCFGITAETLVDKAMELDHYGGTFGGNRKATPFMCLILKMLQIQPEKEIVVEFIKNQDYKYVRVLGAFYLRLIGKFTDVYHYLEPLYNDYRKVRRKMADGTYALTHVDEFIDELLISDYSCDIALPRLPKRWNLEATAVLEPRKSALEDDIDIDDDEDKEDEETAAAAAAAMEISDDKNPKRSPIVGERDRHYRDRDRDNRDYRERRDRERDRERDHRDRERDHRDRDRDRDVHYSSSRRDRGRERDRYHKRRSRSRSRERSSLSPDRRKRYRRSRSHSPQRRKNTSESMEEGEHRVEKKKMLKKKTDQQQQQELDPEIVAANELRAKLGLKPLR